jgi:phage terminase large subunit-like protein
VNAITNYIDKLDHTEEEQEMLPHLYGFPWYKWAWDFFTSTNEFNFICAANQISKSSTLIRKIILFATAVEIWKDLWPGLKKDAPNPFWYFHVSQGLMTDEFEEKWIPEFLPRGEMKNHETFGWEVKYSYQKVSSLTFNSGVKISFKSYEQKAKIQQGGSVYYVACDEELPAERFEELDQRRSATNGYFDMVFTATIGQRFWWRAIEGTGRKETFKDAFKQQISKRDCLTYMDGSPSIWTEEKIRREEERCRNETQKLVRIEGRFIRDFNVLLPSFSWANTIKATGLEEGNTYGLVYVSPETGYAAILALKVNDTHDKAEVVDCHYFEDKDVSSVEMYVVFAAFAERHGFTNCWCNVEGKDFIEIAKNREPYVTPMKMPKFQSAKMMNSLFKYNVLSIVKNSEMAEDFIYQLQNADKDDDNFKETEMVGALVLGCSQIPWQFSKIMGFVEKPRKKLDMPERLKFWRGLGEYAPREEIDSYDRDMEELNDSLENFDQEAEYYG